MIRVRIRYAKTEALRYTGNLNISKIWERYLRRAKLPLAYSQGFHPQPRTNLACPLPLGITSRSEIIDIWFEDDIPLADIRAALDKTAQPGIEIQDIQPAVFKAPALQTQTKFVEYHALLLDSPEPELIRKRVSNLLSKNSIMRKRRNKEYDLRLLIDHLEVLPCENGQSAVLFMRLAARQGATGRPDEVLAALDIRGSDARVDRISLILAEDYGSENT
jgi:radical SAM-linked protein